MSMIKSVVLTPVLFALSLAPAFGQALTLSDDEAAALTARIGDDTYGSVTSVLILSDGQPVYENYFAGTDAGTLHDTRSVTKTVTSMVVGGCSCSAWRSSCWARSCPRWPLAFRGYWQPGS